jgi:hypothetical protein
MNCPFCQQACQPSKKEVKSPNYKGWTCAQHSHEVDFVSHVTGLTYAYAYAVAYQGKQLKVECYKFSEDLPHANSWELWDKGKLIVKLPVIPEHITPDNIEQYLPTLITFS